MAKYKPHVSSRSLSLFQLKAWILEDQYYFDGFCQKNTAHYRSAYICMYTEWTSMDTFLKSAENDGFLYVALTMAN